MYAFDWLKEMVDDVDLDNMLFLNIFNIPLSLSFTQVEYSFM